MHLVVDHVRLHTAFLTVPPGLPAPPGGDGARAGAAGLGPGPTAGPGDARDRARGDAVVEDGAIWIGRGVVEAVGPREVVVRRAPRDAAVLDGRGALAVPGFVDSHIHLCEWALFRLRPSLRECRTADEVVRRLKEASSRLGPSGWLVAGGLEAHCLERWDAPPIDVLDRVSPVRPVVVLLRDLHTAVANRAAIQAAGLGNPPAPAGVASGSDHAQPLAGLGSGLFREREMWRLVEAMPQLSPADLAEVVAQALPELWKVGLVGVQVPEGPRSLGALGVLRERGRLGIRVWFMPPAQMLEQLAALGLRQGFGDEFLRLGPLKAFADGSLTSATAALLEPYAGSGCDEERGMLLMDRQAVAELVRQAETAGFSVAIHAIGDRACRETLRGFELSGICPPPWRPWRIEHAQLLAAQDAARLGPLRVVASVQPIHAPYDRERAERLWAGRTAGAFPLRWIADSGAVLAFGSDAPVEVLDPLKGMYVAVTRCAPPGLMAGTDEAEPWHPEQALTVYEALQAYTWGPAAAVGEGTARGSLAPGLAGDVVLLSEDILLGGAHALASAQVLATIVAGRVVYADGALGH